MEDLLKAIQEWPVIVQGALGSALFALTVVVGQFATKRATELYSRMSRDARVSWLVSAKCKHSAAIAGSDEEHVKNIVVLIYRSSRMLFKALTWLALGLFFETFISVGGAVGYIGCLFYLFRAYQIVAPLADNIDIAAELAKIKTELSALANPK